MFRQDILPFLNTKFLRFARILAQKKRISEIVVGYIFLNLFAKKTWPPVSDIMAQKKLGYLTKNKASE